MTVIAWDGKTLAADKLGVWDGMKVTLRKIEVARGCLVGIAGSSGKSEELMAWFKNGAIPSELPEFQRGSDWCPMIMINAAGHVHIYENAAMPARLYNDKVAIGSGREVAATAMHLGLDAANAVRVCSELLNGCGNGCDVLTLADLR